MTERSRRPLVALAAAALSLWLAACAAEPRPPEDGTGEASQAEESGEHATAEGSAEGAGEHARSEGSGEHGEGGEHSEGGEHAEGGEGGEHGEAGHDEEGEESGVYIGMTETWDAVRRGARLVLSFDAAANAFVGTVENTTEGTLCAVRVEVHLSTGTELGPTERVDLPAGGNASVSLPTGGESFESWTAHPELSPCGDS